MLSVEVKVNGALVAHVYAHNVYTAPDDVAAYEYEVYAVHGGVTRGEIEGFARGQGILKLVRDILVKDMERRRDV